MKLLICIAHHHTLETFEYLNKIINNIQNNYVCSYEIVIHTNSEETVKLLPNLKVIVCKNLIHPFYLTWQHRQYMLDHLNDFDVFMYIEDDIFITYNQLCNYLDNLNILWPLYMPSFLRYEEDQNGEKYSTDTTHPIQINQNNIVKIKDRLFYNFRRYYTGCWVLTKQALLPYLNNSFVSVNMFPNTSRETAASFPNWTLSKPCLIQLTNLENPQVSPDVLIHHLSNKYCKQNLFKPGSHSSVKVKYLFK